MNERHIDDGDGTPEADWLAWTEARAIRSVDAGQLVRRGQRAVVVAPHPDDEVLMVGGLLVDWAALGRDAVVVAVTDGEASHPGSTRWPADRLARRRAAETTTALALLGSDAEVLRLGLPDGHVAAQGGRLAAELQRLLRPTDIVFTTWRLDGHPDHEATAHAASVAAKAAGARLFEVPVWGWHWAKPGREPMPWAAAARAWLSPGALQRKRAAVLAFASQWERDEACQGTPVLRPSVLQRSERPFELVFG